MKRLVSIVLSLIMCAAVLASCGETQKTGHKVLFRDQNNNDKEGQHGL